MAGIDYNLMQLTHHDIDPDRVINNRYTFRGLKSIKMGYICEPKGYMNHDDGHNKIKITMYSIENQNFFPVAEEFVIGKTGMFEIQPETFSNINKIRSRAGVNSENEATEGYDEEGNDLVDLSKLTEEDELELIKREITFVITSIEVPADVKFIIDLVNIED